MPQKNLLTEEEQKRLYLVHHMHHFQDRNKKVIHDLHHCYLFTKKGMKGERFRMKHLLVKNNLFHVLDKSFVGFLYDHKNNRFKIAERKIGDKKYSIVN